MEASNIEVAKVFHVMEPYGAMEATINKARSFTTFVNTVKNRVIPNAISLQDLIQLNKVR